MEKEMRVCEWCGLEFVPFRNDQRFCSTKCRQKNTYHDIHPNAEGRQTILVDEPFCEQLDCKMYAEIRRNKCGALERIPSGDCPFYKTAQQYKREFDKIKERKWQKAKSSRKQK